MASIPPNGLMNKVTIVVWYGIFVENKIKVKVYVTVENHTEEQFNAPRYLEDNFLGYIYNGLLEE